MIVVIGVLILGGAIAAGIIAQGSEPKSVPVPVPVKNNRRQSAGSK
jgi:hypothetical protein